MDKRLFLKLAQQTFVAIPDPYEQDRKRIHAHIARVQDKIYNEIRDKMETWRMPRIPTMDEIVEQAWECFYQVHETPMFPNKFKVNCSPDPFVGDNYPNNFFSNKEAAQKEADFRNHYQSPKSK